MIRAMRGSWTLGVAGLTLLVACAPELSTTGGTGGSGGSGGAGGLGGASSSSASGTGGAGGGPVAVCPDVPDTPTMVLVEAPGEATYCIDSTEVTNAQYVAWLKQMPIVESLPQCAWNTTFQPQITPQENDLPVANVDWCDAYAFCAAHQKRLCGRIGGGQLAYAEATDAMKSQWFNACTGGGTKIYPYGDTYDPTACNGQDKDPIDGTVVPVASLATCEGGFPGIFDMSGNVWEWVDSCDEAVGGTPMENPCRRQGGGYTSIADLDCPSISSVYTRSQTTPNTGFRCCADPL
ncbi:SUMF1/EgtB/PvdO family nonheme iron enzyme [Polyangium sp. 6x1]|uniref:formylglycine-generating enzyme family protein n=1 Tax=Polyangium sp. 6x1 TaxID=3042689 RepID=UPI0024825A4A|nr:SUMF1/EgtB/PvdO family nonheme iron enzyme [Polyangium sp. 6x1]MDI1443683.1 SUMF1/EgtB/PvdO family nonheme iron enzyme [Polyangium sp. 6x1]